MVQAIVNLGEREDRVLNIIKGKYGLKNKSEAVNFVISKYDEVLLEPELRPEFVEKIKKNEYLKGIPFKSIGELRKKYEIRDTS